MDIEKKFGVVMTLTKSTNIKQNIGKNNLCDVIFLIVSLFIINAPLLW